MHFCDVAAAIFLCETITKVGKIDIRYQYSLLFCQQMHQSQYFFGLSANMPLSSLLLVLNRFSLLFILPRTTSLFTLYYRDFFDLLTSISDFLNMLC